MSFKGGVLVVLGIGIGAAYAQQATPVTSVPAVPVGGAPAAQRSGTGWPDYDALEARRAQAQAELTAKHQEIMERYGRNDGPDALAVLQPLRQKLREIDVQMKRLIECEDKPVSDPRALFDKLKIDTRNMGAPDQESLRAYVESRVMDGTLTNELKERFFLVFSLRTRGVMNPASRGAHQIAAAAAGTLRCFGIDEPSTGMRGNAPKRTTEPLLLAKKLAAESRVSLYSYHTSFIGNTEGKFAPIVVLADGGSLIVGTKSDIPPGGTYQIGKSHAVAIRLDPRGKLAWERKLDKKGFMDYEGGSVAPTSDGGFIVFVLSYVHPGRGAVTRFVKLDKKGKLVWDRQLRGDGKVNTPFPSKLVQLTQRGTVALAGHIYIDQPSMHARAMHAWTGELDRNGKLIADKVGDQQGLSMYGGASYGGAGYGGSLYGGPPVRR